MGYTRSVECAQSLACGSSVYALSPDLCSAAMMESTKETDRGCHLWWAGPAAR